MTNLEPRTEQGLTAVLLGNSTTAWGPIVLPHDLTVYGMAGCLLQVNPLATIPVLAQEGSATWSAAIPNDKSFLGFKLYAQAVSTSEGANVLGVIVSNPCTMICGER